MTRSDGKRFIVVDERFDDSSFARNGLKYSIPSDVSILPTTYKSGSYLIGKSAGNYFYEDGIGNHTIINVEKTKISDEYARIEYNKKRAEQERKEEEERLHKVELERKKTIENAMRIIEDELRQFDFIAADMAFEAQETISEELYNRKKAEYVIRWFNECVKDHKNKSYKLDNEQAMAVIDSHKNTLVSARAGSGKTSTLVAKIVFLISKYNYNPDEIIAFVFNKKAKEEINKRLNGTTVNEQPLLSNSGIAFTFHSFAYRIMYSICGENERYGEILFDREDTPYRSLFIQSILKEVPKEQLYSFFRDEMFQIKKSKFASEQEFFESLRSSRYDTLDGRVVRSKAEKIICDYLFEHDIKYIYENEYYLNSAYKICRKDCRKRLYELKDVFGEESIKPDFVLAETNTPWEHWGISGNESLERIREINASGVIGDYYIYKNKMGWKRWFFKKEWVDEDVEAGKYQQQIKDLQPLIETTYDDNWSREDFENRIEEILRSRNLYKPRLPLDELIRRVWDSQVKRFSTMVEQFINRAELLFPNEKDILKKIIEDTDVDGRTRSFLNISMDCYNRYLEYLAGDRPRENLATIITKNGQEKEINFDRSGIDFPMLLQKATDAINENYDSDFLSNDETIYSFLSKKRLILVDEYQDFSRLYLQAIRAVRRTCPRAKLFAVGDDWQAINGFAGSDTEYFEHFEKYFAEDTKRLELSTNYRSGQEVIEYARRFMKNSLNRTDNFVGYKETIGDVSIIDPTDTEIDYKGDSDNIYKDVMRPSSERNPSKYSVQLVKTVAEIIKEHPHEKIMILHRNNDTSIWRVSIESFKKRLERALGGMHIMNKVDYEKNVSVMTMHKSKGLESDVVIILEADEGIIPSYHPDTMLYTVFGDTEETVLKEQKRLFYVAMTRAKDHLYILHIENKNHNGFIGFLRDNTTVVEPNRDIGIRSFF